MASNKTSIKIISTCASLLVSSTVLLSSPLYAQAQTSTLDNSNPQNNSAVFVDDNKNSYGPILKSDTLWKIAVAHRPDETVTNFQVMMALFASNPNAFLRNDINTLVEGQYLRIPTLEEIRTIAPYSYGEQNKTSTEIAANDLANGKVESKTVTSTNNSSAAVKTEPANNDVVTSVDSPEAVASTPVELTEQVSNEAASTTIESVAVEPITVAATNESATPESELNIVQENKELKESLTAVDDQLSYLQYEVAKASEKQSEMDALIAEQKRLLAESKKREQRLLAQQQALAKQREGLLNNPISYWSTTGVLAILVIILFVLVSRRRSSEQLASNNQQALAGENSAKPKTEVSKTTAATEKESNVVSKTTESAKEQDSFDKSDADLSLFAVQNESSIFTSKNTEPESSAEKVEDVKTKPENEHVETAFSKIDLASEQGNDEQLLTDEDLLNSLVNDTPQKKQPSINEVELPNDNDLDIDEIINGMLDEDTKPAQLRSSITGNSKPESTEPKPAKVNEINDFDDVEFDKLLEEISAQTNDVVITPASNVVKMQPATEVKPNKQSSQAEQDYIAIEQLIEESEEVEAVVEEEVYDGDKIDVGLDEFPEFAQDVKHVDVDDDKNGVNAKLDLAQVYIEIGDLDNAAVILKTVMKLGSSSQQQQAQTLLYSLHD
ncbi:FimV/HubP family polar landmark protein [Thalassomonas sp. M1454]|uniref:FimV/HubP family polar landmark protein n=1 Tax=Thalassomonas sp. M1454 TaxID=2594477 RepID=UPI00117E95FA|nr:FimV/HubP family polar landmark protein [Thalassomonas sp. M1454]TRX57277.1 hypothetical protein FNN08_07220 [Thalassomonas sp. M1454]